MDSFVSFVICAPYFYFIFWAMFLHDRKPREQQEERSAYAFENNRQAERFQKIERAQRH